MLPITTAEGVINILSKKEFNKSISALYSRKNSPEDVRKAIIKFYKDNIVDEDTLYKRYRYLKFDKDILGTGLFSTVLSLIMTSVYTAAPTISTGIDFLILFVVLLFSSIAVLAFSEIYQQGFMTKNTILVNPTEIAILEKLLDINPEL